MLHQSTIRAFQCSLKKFTFSKANSFSEDFAIKRFHKKFEEPSDVNADQRKADCWSQWLAFDKQLPSFIDFRKFPELYKARQTLQRVRPCDYKLFSLPQGSEFFSTRGFNSVESRLQRSEWASTPLNFERFARTVYKEKALKRAFRKRYSNWFHSQSFDLTIAQADKFLFRKFNALRPANPEWECFLWKLRQITHMVHGSRFATVPKNNSVDRPINIETFGNMIVQRQEGLHLRQELKRLFSIDLDTLADKHRVRISSDAVSTIDLKNASDSVTLALCEFLLPASVFKQLCLSRSEFILGPDGSYHEVRKLSSMGNGYTFECMSLILNAVVKELDPDGSVFGDDIIINKEQVPRLIEILNAVGFVVNIDKSFIDGPFRESCGGNYHDHEGYVESYDFHWPENIHDCVVIFNKVKRLAKKYPSFVPLYGLLRRQIPKALQGPTEDGFFEKEKTYFEVDGDQSSPSFLSGYFRCDKQPKMKDEKLRKWCNTACYKYGDVGYFTGFSYEEKLHTPQLKKLKARHWAKYEMYLHSMRVSKDTITGSGRWVECRYVSVPGAAFRRSSMN